MDDNMYMEKVLACERKLYRVAYSMLLNEFDAADAIQEAVMKGWVHRNALRESERFDAWLMRILVNECRNIQRRWKRRGEPLDEAIPAPENTVDPDLQEALFSLPGKFRAPLVLHHVEGYSLREIARILKIPETTVKSRLHQARAALKQALSPEVKP